MSSHLQKIVKHLEANPEHFYQDINKQVECARQDELERTRRFKAKAERSRKDMEHREKLAALLDSRKSSVIDVGGVYEEKLVSDLVKSRIWEKRVQNGSAGKRTVEYDVLKEEGHDYDQSLYTSHELDGLIETLNGKHYLNLTRYSLVKAVELAG